MITGKGGDPQRFQDAVGLAVNLAEKNPRMLVVPEFASAGASACQRCRWVDRLVPVSRQEVVKYLGYS